MANNKRKTKSPRNRQHEKSFADNKRKQEYRDRDRKEESMQTMNANIKTKDPGMEIAYENGIESGGYFITEYDLQALARDMQTSNEEDEENKYAGYTVKEYPEQLKTITTKTTATTTAFLIGVKGEYLRQLAGEGSGIIDELNKDKDAVIMRNLCMIRSQLIRFTKSIDTEMMANVYNIDRISYFEEVEFDRLEEYGVRAILPNTTAGKYITELTKMINERADSIRHLYPDWIEWEYIRDLFYIKNPDKPGVMKGESDRFNASRCLYPYQTYMNWKPRDGEGNILFNDKKFLELLYLHNMDEFRDESKCTDAGQEAKNGIYEFIEKAGKVVMVVDCENSDLFKLCSVINGLDSEKLKKIDRIVLYDDANTTEAWDWLEQFTSIRVEHIEVERLVDRKSLVDIMIAAGICKNHYEEGIDSVILFSSDSDYWGLISSLPQVNFLVMYEKAKCGQAIKEALKEHGIFYCPIDNFCTTDVPALKNEILFSALEKDLPNIFGRDPMEITKELYAKTKIYSTAEEVAKFCDRYVRTIKMVIRPDGKFGLEIQKKKGA